jgi:biotin-dependent carboxylase-like uncharacterized protein
VAFKVIHPGLVTTVQDLGRPGYFHLGIPIGGAMDQYALRMANVLVGNDEGTACLEAVFVGPTLEFGRDSIVAVTGADMPIKVDGEEQKGWQSFKIRAGQVLSFDFLAAGARIYIAISGGIDVPLALGSRSTYHIGALGGFDGRPLQMDDQIPLGKTSYDVSGRLIPDNFRNTFGELTKLRVLPGLYSHRITTDSSKTFYSEEWKVASEADRMGYRFTGGSPVQFIEREQPFGAGNDPSNIVDSCYPYGSIQIPGGTEPIVLHRDAVSGGGYFMIGTVISADMDLIAQLQPHARVKFVEVDMPGALLARRERNNRLSDVRQLLT